MCWFLILVIVVTALECWECGCRNISQGHCNCEDDMDEVVTAFPSHLACVKDEDGDGECELYQNGTQGSDSCGTFTILVVFVNLSDRTFRCDCRNISIGHVRVTTEPWTHSDIASRKIHLLVVCLTRIMITSVI